MARDIYYQQVGNPLQLKRLPNRRPDLQLPYHPHTPGQDTRLAVKMLFLLLVFYSCLSDFHILIFSFYTDEVKPFSNTRFTSRTTTHKWV